jgi:hypothetical protein
MNGYRRKPVRSLRQCRTGCRVALFRIAIGDDWFLRGTGIERLEFGDFVAQDVSTDSIWLSSTLIRQGAWQLWLMLKNHFPVQVFWHG